MTERQKLTIPLTRYLEARLGFAPGDSDSGRLVIHRFEVSGNRFRVDYIDADRGRMGFVGVWEMVLFRGSAGHDTTTAKSATPELFEGLNQKQFAAVAGVDHRTLAEHLVDIPTGPSPALPPGKVPARLIGSTRRIFLADFLGLNQHEGRSHGAQLNAQVGPRQLPAPGADPDGDWRGPLRKLRQG